LLAADIPGRNAHTHQEVNDIAQRKLIQIRCEPNQCPAAHQLECKRLMGLQIVADKRQSRCLQLGRSLHQEQLIESPEITFQLFLIWRRPKVRELRPIQTTGKASEWWFPPAEQEQRTPTGTVGVKRHMMGGTILEMR